MADRRTPKSARPRPAPSRRLTAGEFRATPEFRHFKAVMRRLVGVPKAELDRMVREAKEKPPNKPARRRRP